MHAYLVVGPTLPVAAWFHMDPLLPLRSTVVVDTLPVALVGRHSRTLCSLSNSSLVELQGAYPAYPKGFA